MQAPMYVERNTNIEKYRERLIYILKIFLDALNNIKQSQKKFKEQEILEKWQRMLRLAQRKGTKKNKRTINF